MFVLVIPGNMPPACSIEATRVKNPAERGGYHVRAASHIGVECLS